MDALQIISSATQIVSSMAGAVAALEQASWNLEEAPKKIRSLEEFVISLQNLTRRVKQKHIHKLDNSQLDHQIQSLNGLIERLHVNLRKARKMVSRSRVKNFARVVWNSVSGDPLPKLLSSIMEDLNWWLESQKLAENVERVLETTAQNATSKLRVNSEQGYPISKKCQFVRSLLEKEGSHRVILVVGLSGIGKSCLARQVASDPPARFIHGAAELSFGQWCSKAACNGSKIEYQKRLTRKICKFLVQIGFWKNFKDENCVELEYICCLLQEALYGKSILVLLDDVWEQDIVDRFAKLYDNDCRYLVTTRNEAVYEITEAEKVEICKDDIKEISKAILLYHSLLTNVELPGVTDDLLGRCGHHPLTVAVMGKALRKEIRAEKWETAIYNLSTYATFAPGPVSYVNEKEAEDTLTIFGSFEFSLEAMPENSRRLFIVLSALSWAEPIPEACLEALWLVLGQDSLFPLIICKLVEGSLLMKTDSYPIYHVHDMVSLYLDSKTNDAVEILLTDSTPERTASISPWLFIFGKETVKTLSEQMMKSFLSVSQENLAVITLESIIQALMASKSISEFEASRESFSSILQSKIANLILIGSSDLIVGSAKAIMNVFSTNDYRDCAPSLENVNAVDKLTSLLENCKDPMIQTSVSTVLAKLSEYGSPQTTDKVLQKIPIHQLANLLAPDAEEWHESVFSTLMSLTKAGKSKAIEIMLASGVDKNLFSLLENGSEVSQHHALVILKTFYELGGPIANGSLRPGMLKVLPWHARLRLEKFVFSDRNVSNTLKPQTFEDLIQKILDRDYKHRLEAIQDLIPIVEKAGDPRIEDMIIQSPLIGRLSELLQHGNPEQNSTSSESAFLLMKLACSCGESCMRKFVEYEIVPELVKMMQCNVPELQDSAYTALHQMLFGNSGTLILSHILQMGLLERFAHSIDSKSIKTREVSVHCILDLIELGNKACIERILSLQVVEKLVKFEKTSGGSGDTLICFLKGMDKCKHLTTAERQVMKKQVVRKVRAAVKGHKSEGQIVAALDAFLFEGPRGASSSKKK